MWAVPSVFPQGGTQFLFEVGVTHADGFSLCTVHLGLDHTGAFKFFQCACNDRLRDVSLCGDQIEVLSDAKVAVENITRYAGTQGYQVAVDTVGEDFKLTLTK